MQATLGYQPSILPHIDRRDALSDDSRINDGVSRHSQRLRELAVQQLAQTTARERTERAWRSKARKVVQPM
eukprot:12936531-Prorocentrum_lima.AAC.1